VRKSLFLTRETPPPIPIPNSTPPYNTGEPYIVELVLPEAATTIALYGFGQFYSTQVAFTSLMKVSGANVKTIDKYAFRNCAALTTAGFSLATSIDTYAFYRMHGF
jgi:hypothetical protein